MGNNDKDNDETTNENNSHDNESKLLNTLSIITDNLETYQGRDTAITLVHYIPLIIADMCLYYSLSCSRISDNFVNMYLVLANCRVMLRLFDDFNAIRELYRFFQKDQSHLNTYIKWVNVINLLFWVFYNPAEHLAWLAELKLINTNEHLWWFYTNFCWAGGLLTSVILNLWVLILYAIQENTKSKREDDDNYDSSKLISKNDVKQAIIIATRDFADFCIAVHYLPEGFLWSSHLYNYQIGLLGTYSSICRVPTYLLGKN